MIVLYIPKDPKDVVPRCHCGLQEETRKIFKAIYLKLSFLVWITGSAKRTLQGSVKDLRPKSDNIDVVEQHLTSTTSIVLSELQTSLLKNVLVPSAQQMKKH